MCDFDTALFLANIWRIRLTNTLIHNQRIKIRIFRYISLWVFYTSNVFHMENLPLDLYLSLNSSITSAIKGKNKK